MDNFVVEEVKTREQLNAVVVTLADHSDDLRHLFFPILHRRETSLQEIGDRIWHEHTHDPSSHWIFVRDPAGGSSNNTLSVLGTCQWRFYGTDPFAGGSAGGIDAPWWPAGGGREYTKQAIACVMVPRAQWMTRAHAGMSWMAVVQKHRRRGIGRALMAWGLEETDRLGLESYIEASLLGRLLYEKCGYEWVTRIRYDIRNGDGDETWKDFEARFSPFEYDVVWRPIRGVKIDEKTQQVWDKRADGIEEDIRAVIRRNKS